MKMFNEKKQESKSKDDENRKSSDAEVVDSTVDMKKSSKGTAEFDIPTASELQNFSSDKEEEDIPPDFFDDFLNQEFIDGLDVVDAWEAGDDNDNKKSSKTETEIKNKAINKDKDVKNNAKYVSKSQKCQQKNINEEEKNKRKSSERKDQKVDNINRRDPDKTKRDIQRDKDKRAKDREVKLISEKLKVVETGLVPPGMEMEVDLKEIQQQTKTILVQNEKKKQEIKADLKFEKTIKEHKPIIVSRSKEKAPYQRLSGRSSRSKSKERYVTKMRSRSRSANLYKNPYAKEKKPRSRSRSFQKFDLRERLSKKSTISPHREKLHKRREESPEKSRRGWRYFRNTSPDVHKTFLRDSMESNTSDREKWLRNRYRHSRERSPLRTRNRNSSRRSISLDRDFCKRKVRSSSKSPIRKKGKTFLEELDAELTKNQYYKEIHKKLNPTTTTMQQMIVPQNTLPLCQDNFIHPVPNPHIPSYQPMEQFYNEQFFIGQPVANPFNTVPSNEFDSFVRMNQIQPVPNPYPSTSSYDSTMTEEKATVERLFADKKISLSDYLHVTSKSADSSKPVNIQNKIKVISRCQDAIKELSGEVKKDFVVVKSNRVAEKSAEIKYQSPLKKQQLVRFQFTTPQKSSEESLFTKSINRLIGRLRINNESHSSPKLLSDASKIITQPCSNVPYNLCSAPVKKVSLYTQTDAVHCENCEKRSARKFVERGTQTVSIMTFNVATQIEDLGKESAFSSTDMLKNVPMAYLTTAQLLGQAKQKTDAVTGYSPTKQPLIDISQEKRQRELLFNRNVTDRNFDDMRRDDRYNNLAVKRPLLGTPVNSKNVDPRLINSTISNLNFRPNAFPTVNHPNFVGNFNPNVPLQNRPQYLNPALKPNFGYPADRRF